ncbi:MAG: exodeoxyribonuclease VII small subunit [Patescibacteria group bacterium]
MTQRKDRTASFKEQFDELEALVEEFEKGELDLDESLKKFERGLQLAAACKERLSLIENTVKEIKAKFGTITTDEP